MACAALFAPVSMLLAVFLAVLPLMLPSSSAGSAVHPHAKADPAVVRPDTNRVLHLRQVNFSLAVPSVPAAEWVSPAVPSRPSRSQRARTAS